MVLLYTVLNTVERITLTGGLSTTNTTLLHVTNTWFFPTHLILTLGSDCIFTETTYQKKICLFLNKFKCKENINIFFQL